LVLAGLVWSGWAPHDRFTWWLEVAPVLIVLPLLLVTARRFPWTPLSYTLIAAHCWVLMVGGHWTYAEVPAGFWVKDALGLDRNPYDRLGHLMQGFVPAIVAREVLWRTSPLRGSRWLAPLVLSVCLAVSACYELVEWLVAVVTGSAAEAFLGTQGDVWDTQWDMAMAGVGAACALLLQSGLHERQLRRLVVRSPDRHLPGDCP
jgi:putative membrane protein